MLRGLPTARSANPAVRWRVVLPALGLIAVTALAIVAIAVAAPVQRAPVQRAPVQRAPVQRAPVQRAPVQQAPVQLGTRTAGTISHVCPSSNRPGTVDPSRRPGAQTELVPPGAINVQLCNYNGLEEPGIIGEPAFSLLAQRFVGSTTEVDRLAAELNALPPPSPYPIACPADSGTGIVAYFGYPSGVDDLVSVADSGCGGAGNGLISRATGPVVAAIARLVPAPPLGILRGEVQLCGGVAPGGCRISTFTGCGPSAATCATTDRVGFDTLGGRRIGVLRLRHARFSTAIAAGRYLVELLGDGPHVHRKVLQTQRARVRAGRTTNVEFSVDVP